MTGKTMKSLHALVLVTILFSPFAAQAKARGKATRKSCGLPPDALALQPKAKSFSLAKTGWQNGQTIPVYFLNGSTIERNAVILYARQWERYANINFDFRNGAKKDDQQAIIIRFAKQKPNVAGWSIVGQGTTGKQASMEFDSARINSQHIMHEFGHALGLLHEFQSPGGAEVWNMNEVYPYFKETMGMSKDEVDAQIFANHSSGITVGEFDRRSVMAYEMPAYLFKSGKSMRPGLFPSPQDKIGIAKLYPGRSFDPNQIDQFYPYSAYGGEKLKIDATKASVTVTLNGTQTYALPYEASYGYKTQTKEFDVTEHFKSGQVTSISVRTTPNQPDEGSTHVSIGDNKRGFLPVYDCDMNTRIVNDNDCANLDVKNRIMRQADLQALAMPDSNPANVTPIAAIPVVASFSTTPEVAANTAAESISIFKYMESSNEYEPSWHDSGSGAATNGAFWAAKVNDHQVNLGQNGLRSYDLPAAGDYVVSLQKGITVLPKRYLMIWKDTGSGAQLDGALWQAECPNGYGALGMVFTPNHTNPQNRANKKYQIACINTKYVVESTITTEIWNDRQSGAKSDVSIWAISGSNYFVGTRGYEKPTFKVYKLKL